jgi:hypothetical protein
MHAINAALPHVPATHFHDECSACDACLCGDQQSATSGYYLQIYAGSVLQQSDGTTQRLSALAVIRGSIISTRAVAIDQVYYALVQYLCRPARGAAR